MASVRSLARSRARRSRLGAIVPLAVVVSFAVAGPIALAGAASGSAASPAVPSSCTNTNPITIDGGTSGSITAADQTDCYTFTGNAGDRIRITVTETSGTLEAETSVADPSDAVVCGPTTDSAQTCALASSGEHTILIRDSAGTNTGDYNVSALALHRACADTNPITLGDPASTGEITNPGEVDCFTFSGTAGDRIHITVAATSGTLVPNTEVDDPNDTTTCGPTTTTEQTCQLAVTGVHTIVIQDVAGTGTGGYTVAADALHAACTNTNAITLGDPASSGSITAVGQADCYTFSGNNGDLIHVTVAETSGTLEANTSLIDPGDAVECGPTTDTEQTCQLSSSGTHTILIRDSAATNTGDYTVAAEKLPPVCTNTNAITLGDPASAGSITDPAQVDCYTFDGTAGDRIKLTVATTSGSLEPKTSLIDSGYTTICGPTTDSEQICTLASNGVYTITIRDASATNTGDYTVAAEHVVTTCTDVPQTPISPGAPPLSGSISSAGDSDCYSFKAKQGALVRVVVAETGGNLEASTLVTNLNDTNFCGPTTATEMTCKVTRRGFHTVMVQDATGSNAGTYNVYVQLLAMPGFCGGVDYGTTAHASINAAAENDCYTFKAGAGKRVRVRVVATDGTLVPNTALFNSNGTAMCPATTAIEQTCRVGQDGYQTIIIRDDLGTNTGGYNIYVQLSRTLGCGHPKFGATARAGFIGIAGQTDCYRFLANRGDRVRLRVVKTDGTLEPNTEIWSPNGLTYCGPSTAIDRTCQVGTTGMQTILIRDLTGPNTGGYTVYVQLLNAPLECVPISFGAPALSGSITVAGDADCYTFPGVRYDHMRVRVVETGGTLEANTEIVNPTGTTRCGPSNAIEQSCTLSASGQHTIMISDLGDTGAGTYTISLQRLNVPVSCIPITVGAPATSGSITIPGNVDCYTFDGTIGQSVHVQVVQTGGALVPNTEIVNPKGLTLCGPSTQADQQCRLNVTGSSAVLIRDVDGPNLGDYTISVS